MQRQPKFIVGSGVILVTLACLAWLGFRESKTYYHTVAELSTLNGMQARQRMRVGGDVGQGSIRRLPGHVDFTLQAEGKTLLVSYVGSDPLPDTFGDNSQALVEGKLAADGAFIADKVQAKCASKYEAVPGQPGPFNKDSGAAGYSNKKS